MVGIVNSNLTSKSHSPVAFPLAWQSICKERIEMDSIFPQSIHNPEIFQNLTNKGVSYLETCKDYVLVPEVVKVFVFAFPPK